MTRFAQLPSRAVVTVSGSQARAFLNSLLTVNTLALSAPRWGLLLSPQGRFLHEMFVLPRGEDVWLETEALQADVLIKRLKAYALRAQLSIERREMPVGAAWEGAMPENAYADPRDARLGWRVLGEGESNADYDTHRLSLGIPGSEDMVIDKSLPLEFGVDLLHAVDFDKGCYVGQEVTARMRYRANIRKRLYRVEGVRELPPPGTELTLAGQKAGELRSHKGSIGLALLNAEVLAAHPGEALTAEGLILARRLPDWAENPA